ncbi:type II toxin-antitoxin system HigB family toxin [Persicobacter psychrovividus]|uniref:Type II toxin-antitoxin system HigB family toxin n=1 Tax=Persicobacter psychrovividus TaxID=387638 RepID=A0ABN6LKJ2_9BACT|nr:hypothetical protein PEPS_42570 [Persicobacter psychrovividus]
MLKKRNRIISKKRIHDFAQDHPDSLVPLKKWMITVESGSFSNFHDLKSAFRAPDKVGRNVVFNIGANKYRLVAKVEFYETGATFFIRGLFTHKEYDQQKIEKL